MKPWIHELLKRERFTSEEAGAIIGCYGPDSSSRIKANRHVELKVIGKEPSGKGRHQRKVYKLNLRQQPPAEAAI